MNTPNRAAILLAHGSSDSLWLTPLSFAATVAKPFRRTKSGIGLHGIAEPNLTSQVQSLVQGYVQLEIIPLFFCQGMHLRKQVPKLLTQLSAELLPSCPKLSLVLHEPVGLEDEVAAAISQVIARKLA